MRVPTIRATPLTPIRPDGPLLVVGASLGTTTALWQPVATALSSEVEVLGVDLPGHGAGPAATIPFSVEDLAAGILSAIQRHRGRLKGFYYAGDSLGGAAGLALAMLVPQRLSGLAAVCTAAKIGDRAGWAQRAALVRSQGVGSVVESSRQRWFAPGFVERESRLTAALLDQLRHVDAESYALACEALAAFDLRDELHRITVPTIAVSGSADVATPPEKGAEIAAGVPNARHVVLDGVGHLAPIEAPEQMVMLLRELLLTKNKEGRAP